MEAENSYENLSTRVHELERELAESKKRIDQLETTIENARRRTTATQKVSTGFEPASIENFVGLKLIHFVGIIVLIIGLSIGVKYAIDINLISPTVRILLAYAAGILLLFLSFKIRQRFELFSMILFSGSMASLYFTSYAAFEYYQMLPRALAFSIMLLLTFFTVYTALKNDRAQIAMLGLVGAYGIPFFVGGRSGNIDMLMLYVSVINLGVLFLSFKKYWPQLIQLAFVTTWIIYFSCLYRDYGNGYRDSLELFAYIVFLTFLLSGLAFKLYRRIALIDADTILLICNTLFLYFSINFLKATPTGHAWAETAIIFALIYLAAGFLSRRWLPQQRFLNDSLLGVGITALAGYIALEFSGFSITVIWVLLAVVIFIAGMYLRIKLLRVAAIFLFGATLAKLLLIDSRQFSAVQKVTGYILTGTILLVVSFLYQKFKRRIFDEE